MSSDVVQLDSGLPQLSSEILLDLKVSRFQSMPLESIQKRLTQAPERLEAAQETNPGDEASKKVTLVKENAHSERSQQTTRPTEKKNRRGKRSLKINDYRKKCLTRIADLEARMCKIADLKDA